MEFTGIKLTKSEFKFKSKEEYQKYFNDALIESPFQFVRISKAEFNENIHIALSWSEITKIISWTLLGVSLIVSLLSVGLIFNISVIALGFLSLGISKLFKNKAKDLSMGKAFCIEMYESNNFENLEEVREDLKKENK